MTVISLHQKKESTAPPDQPHAAGSKLSSLHRAQPVPSGSYPIYCILTQGQKKTFWMLREQSPFSHPSSADSTKVLFHHSHRNTLKWIVLVLRNQRAGVFWENPSPEESRKREAWGAKLAREEVVQVSHYSCCFVIPKTAKSTIGQRFLQLIYALWIRKITSPFTTALPHPSPSAEHSGSSPPH